jgi:uncharacterized protein involved in exopolysaccharide biosynthesis
LGLDPAENNLRFLEEHLTRTKRAIASQQAQLTAFMVDNNIVSLPDEAKALANDYTLIKTNLSTAKVEGVLARQEARILSGYAERMINACVEPDVQLSSSGNTMLYSLYKRTKELEAEMAVMRLSMTEGHPELQNKEEELQVVSSQLRREVDRELSLLKVGIAPAVTEAIVRAAISQAQTEGLQQALRQVQRRVDQFPANQARFTQLSAELEATRKTYEMLREEWTKASLIADSRGPMYTVLDPAEVPLERNPRGTVRMLALFFILGLGLSLLLPYRAWIMVQQRQGNVVTTGE